MHRISRRDILSRYSILWNEFLQSLQPPSPSPSGKHSQNGHFPVVYLLVAILINHIRRILAPWMAQFLWCHAMEDMKFARSSPHYYLQTAMEYDFWDVVKWMCWSQAIRFVHGLMRRRVLQGAASDIKANGKEKKKPQGVMMMDDVCRVIHLALLLAEMERAYVSTCWVGAQVYAYTRLLALGNDSEKGFLKTLLLERWPRAVLQWGFVLRWFWRGFVPEAVALMSSRPAGLGAVVRLLLHGVVWRGTMYLVRYSNKYFLVLQMSDMVVTFGWMGVVVLWYVARAGYIIV